MEGDIEKVRLAIQEVLKGYDLASLLRETGGAAAPPSRPGIFRDLDAAVSAAHRAQTELVALPLGQRKLIVDAMRRTVLDNNEALSREAVGETGLGNVGDKMIKNRLAALKTPGPEDLETSAWSDENGLCIMERAPYGVLGAITPCTNPIATICSNGIGMIAAGNSVVFNVHPAAKRTSVNLTAMINESIMRAGGPANLLVALDDGDRKMPEQYRNGFFKQRGFP